MSSDVSANSIQVIDEKGHAVLKDAREVLGTSMVDATYNLRRIPRHVFPFAMSLVVNGEPQIVSDSLVSELGLFACVDQKSGKVVNGTDRTRALVVVFPAGKFECINLDNPDERLYR